MGYSTNKPYQRTKYRAPTDSSYDRYLKSGTMVGNKESTLEKPYKTSTYAQMQQDFNLPLPPSFDWGDLPIIPGIDLPPPPGDVIPIGGTGALTCYWTSTGCEQLVGCWAGSDLVLDGPEAATAGYLAPDVSAGEIVQTTISGAENRGIDFVLNPLVPRNTFTVSFKDANGVIASQTIDITCAAASKVYTFYPMAGADGVAKWGALSLIVSTTGFDLGLDIDESPVDTYDYWAWVVFDTVNIFKDGVINSAYIKLYFEGAQTVSIETAEIYVYDGIDGESTPDAITVAFPTYFYATPVSWTVSVYNTAVADGSSVLTADITSLVQYIVNLPAWPNTGNIGFVIKPLTGNADVLTSFYEEGGVYDAELIIDSPDGL